ncbi:MAG: RNA polymerase sigma factor [Patescibacteria group bacterium]
MINSLSEKSDQELVSLTLVDQNNFGYLIERYEQKLLRYIRRLSNINMETAEDILQETFIKVYKNLNGYDQSMKFSSWIYRIAHNEVINYFRKNKNMGTMISLDEENGLINILTSAEKTEKNAIDGELNKKMTKVLNMLDDKYKDILILKYLEEKDYQEISDILQIPTNTVGTLIHRGKAELKKLAMANKLDSFLNIE